MKKVLLITFMAMGTTSFASELNKGQVHYLEDLVIPFEQLLHQESFVIVDLYAQWCGPCKKLGSVLNTIAKNNPDVVVLKVDIEQFDNIRTKYNVKSIPTVLLFKNGKKVSHEVGFISEQDIQALIDTIMQ